MTTMTAAVTPAQPRVIDRFVVTLSLAMLDWARRRADRAFISRDRHNRLLGQAAELQRREHDFAKRAARVV
ncbi:hypothetical protein GCM10022381_14770 [Leifsonia kafniensis]|uniref:Uncharacterized protein n=1 Tax=Leifsonia kafniensis TaxID=475957 RepID=A0ABP7KE15_9MICO